MLILSRKMGESIHVGDTVTVTILGVSRGQVKIGIDAPRDLAVHRHEIYQRIQNGVPETSSRTKRSVRSQADDSSGDSSDFSSR